MSNFDDIYKMNRSKKRRKDMIFKILCAGTFLLLASIVFTVIYLTILKAAKEDFSESETETVYDIEEIKEVSLDDIPNDPEAEQPIEEWAEKSKDEQYVKDISEAFPEEVVEAAKESVKEQEAAMLDYDLKPDYDNVPEDNIIINTDTPYWDEVLSEQEIGYIENDIQITDKFIEENGWLMLNIGLSKELQIFTQEACAAYDVPYSVALALMESESTFRSDIGNEQILGGEEGGPRYYGYMQLSWDNCEAAKNYSLDAHTPEGNIEMGILLLSGYLEDYNGDVTNAIMAYKGGKGAADSWIASGYVLPSAEKVATRAEYYDLELQDLIKKIEGE